MLNLAFFGMDGPWSARPLMALAERHRIAAVVRALPARIGAASAGGLRPRLRSMLAAVGLRREGALAALARRHAAPCFTVVSREDTAPMRPLADLALDLICVAGFPWILGPAIPGLARLGAINLHGSLLPRHRGILPLFWIYHADDRETGVTVHRLGPRPDAGDILLQESFPLPRGFPVDRLNLLNAERGAALLLRTVDSLERGALAGTPQEEALATRAPRPPEGAHMIDFDEWDVERVWHFTAGLFPRYREPLTDETGGPVSYTGVRGFDRSSHSRPPGTTVPTAGGWDVYCLGGILHLAGRP